VSSLTGSVISGGALGTLASVTSKLSNYTALDSYQRNFTVNLSGLIAKAPTAATTNPLPTNVNTGPTKIKFAEDTELGFIMPMTQTQNFGMGSTGSNLGYMSYSDQASPPMGYVSYTKGDNMVAVGYGGLMPAQYSYTKAMYGNDDAAMMASEMSTHVAAYSDGGSVAAYGTQLGDFRVAFGVNSTANNTNPTDPMNWAVGESKSVTQGVTYAINKTLQVGFSQTTLTEQHGLLGSNYDPNSALSFGASNASREMGVSAVVKFDANRSLYMEYSEATTAAAAPASNSMFAGTSDIKAQAYGVSYTNHNAYTAEDKLTVSFKMPMAVTSGSVNMAQTMIDPVTGVPSVVNQAVSLAPSGREMDLMVGYTMPLSKTQKLGLSAGYTANLLNEAGTNVAKAGVTWNVKF
jgi:hypothetical protein